MATFTVTELRSDTGIGEFPIEPPITVQAITTSGSSQQSAAFNGDTRWVVLTTDGSVRILFGTNPTALATSPMMQAGSSAPILMPRGGGLKVAVINA